MWVYRLLVISLYIMIVTATDKCGSVSMKSGTNHYLVSAIGRRCPDDYYCEEGRDSVGISCGGEYTLPTLENNKSKDCNVIYCWRESEGKWW